MQSVFRGRAGRQVWCPWQGCPLSHCFLLSVPFLVLLTGKGQWVSMRTLTCLSTSSLWVSTSSSIECTDFGAQKEGIVEYREVGGVCPSRVWRSPAKCSLCSSSLGSLDLFIFSFYYIHKCFPYPRLLPLHAQPQRQDTNFIPGHQLSKEISLRAKAVWSHNTGFVHHDLVYYSYSQKHL